MCVFEVTKSDHTQFFNFNMFYKYVLYIQFVDTKYYDLRFLTYGFHIITLMFFVVFEGNV